MTGTTFARVTTPWLALLRWNKPTGRLILLIPAGWSLWLAPAAPPSLALLLRILIGGLAVSGAGCVANDLWDQRIDSEVERTRQRPLASGTLNRSQALVALVLLLGRCGASMPITRFYQIASHPAECPSTLAHMVITATMMGSANLCACKLPPESVQHCNWLFARLWVCGVDGTGVAGCRQHRTWEEQIKQLRGHSPQFQSSKLGSSMSPVQLHLTGAWA